MKKRIRFSVAPVELPEFENYVKNMNKKGIVHDNDYEIFKKLPSKDKKILMHVAQIGITYGKYPKNVPEFFKMITDDTASLLKLDKLHPSDLLGIADALGLDYKELPKNFISVTPHILTLAKETGIPSTWYGLVFYLDKAGLGRISKDSKWWIAKILGVKEVSGINDKVEELARRVLLFHSRKPLTLEELNYAVGEAGLDIGRSYTLALLKKFDIPLDRLQKIDRENLEDIVKSIEKNVIRKKPTAEKETIKDLVYDMLVFRGKKPTKTEFVMGVYHLGLGGLDHEKIKKLFEEMKIDGKYDDIKEEIDHIKKNNDLSDNIKKKIMEEVSEGEMHKITTNKLLIMFEKKSLTKLRDSDLLALFLYHHVNPEGPFIDSSIEHILKKHIKRELSGKSGFKLKPALRVLGEKLIK